MARMIRRLWIFSARSGKTPYECLDWLITEIVFREPAFQTAHRFAALHRPFYCYNFARVSPGARRSSDLARHTGEIRYVFGNLTTDGQYDETDQVIADVMQSAWTAFARTGVPTVAWEAAWPAVDIYVFPNICLSRMDSCFDIMRPTN